MRGAIIRIRRAGVHARQARRRIAFTLVPMVFVLTITLWALGKLAIANLQAAQGLDVALVNALAATALIALAIFLAGSALVRVRMERRATAEPARVV